MSRLRTLLPVLGTPLAITLATSLAATLAPGAAQAAPSRNTVSGPGGFVTACISAKTPGNGFAPGDDIEGHFPAGDCKFDVFSGPGTASASQQPVAGDPITGGAIGSTSLGAIHLGTQYALGSGGFFPMAAATGGYTDLMVPNDPALTGQSGFLLIAMDVFGGLKANGNAGSSQFQLTMYKNGAQLMKQAPGFDMGTGIASSTDRQWATWAAASFPFPFEGDSQDVNETLIFSVPVTFGTAFELGVYATSASGGRNSSGVGSAHSDFAHSVYWGGVQGALVNGKLVTTGLSITSASGVDWMQPFSATVDPPVGSVPTPASMPLVLAGMTLAAVATVRPRRRSLKPV